MTTQDSRPGRDAHGLQEQIRESFQAGRISASEEKAVQYMIRQHGNEAGLRVLQYFEKMNFISAYLEDKVNGFKMREFVYHPNLPGAEKQKIALALKEALSIIELDQRMEGCR